MMGLEEQWQAVVPLPQPDGPPVAWEDPALSGVAGCYRTLRDVLWRPGDFFENLGPGGWAEPLAFAFLVSTAGLLGTLFWHFLILVGGAIPGEAELPGLGPGVLLGLMVGSPLWVLIDLGVGGLCWWGSVTVMGATGGFTPAWRIFAYAHAGLALALIPLFGPPLAGIWFLALLYIGTWKRLGFNAWESLGALAVFIAFQVALGFVLLIGLIAVLAGLGFLALLG
jgi:hypothetical protein